MDFGYDDVQVALVDEVDRVLDAAPQDLPARERFRLLGDRRLVAVHYPEALGGRGLRLVDHAVVTERAGLHGLPDEVHLVTIQGVGCTLLTAGTDAQRERWLPRVAAGECFASLLLSEAGAGSDLAGIETQAVPEGDHYVVTGQKTWNLRADWSAFGLCSARTRDGDAYDAISVLLIPLDAPGVTVTPVPRAMGEPYFTVSFDGVRVGRDALVGTEHRGWSLLVRAIGFERAGFDYLSRAHRWLRAAEAAAADLPADRRDAARDGLIRHERAVAAARAMAFRTVITATDLEMDEVASAYSKLACGEAAQAVAWWAAETVGPLLDGDAPYAMTLRTAVAEAPELSISGGATELQLDLIAIEQRAVGGA
jgi:3-oxo-4-pregnene-20-carboxyl-CoA dehydrogenase beta subunit